MQSAGLPLSLAINLILNVAVQGGRYVPSLDGILYLIYGTPCLFQGARILKQGETFHSRGAKFPGVQA